MTTVYSLHHIRREGEFGFEPAAYSRFKFGDGGVAERFGADLARGFVREWLSKRPITEQIVVVSSPYAFIPTATFAMKDAFVRALNRWLVAEGLRPVEETKVHRTVTYKEDYGELSAEQRLRLISNDSFHIDRAFLEGKTLLFLDDIKITGSHQRMIEKMIAQYRLDNDVYMLYFAELVNPEIHPRIENFLNYFGVKTIFDLQPIVAAADFRINTRLVKYLLNSDPADFRTFVLGQDEGFVNLVYDMAIGNGYHLIAAYEENLNFIRNHFIETIFKLQDYGH